MTFHPARNDILIQYWIEQGGRIGANNSTTTPVTVSLFRAFQNTSYNLSIGLYNGTNNTTWEHGRIQDLGTTSFTIWLYDNYFAFWRAFGY